MRRGALMRIRREIMVLRRFPSYSSSAIPPRFALGASGLCLGLFAIAKLMCESPAGETRPNGPKAF